MDALSVAGELAAMRQIQTKRICMNVLTAKHAWGLLERSLEITFCRLAKDVQSDGLCLKETLDAHKTLDEERLSILHVQMQENHHSNSHIDCTQLPGC